MPSLKWKIMREYTRVTSNNAEISEIRDTEFLEGWESHAHAQTACTRPTLLTEGLGNEATSTLASTCNVIHVMF